MDRVDRIWLGRNSLSYPAEIGSAGCFPGLGIGWIGIFPCTSIYIFFSRPSLAFFFFLTRKASRIAYPSYPKAENAKYYGVLYWIGSQKSSYPKPIHPIPNAYPGYPGESGQLKIGGVLHLASGASPATPPCFHASCKTCTGAHHPCCGESASCEKVFVHSP